MNANWDSVEILLIDSHVHIYPCFDVNLLFSRAVEHFDAAFQQKNKVGKYIGVILLAESYPQDWFNTAYNQCLNSPCLSYRLQDWEISIIEDDEQALLVRNLAGSMLLVIKGFQIVTYERLEVLTLGASYRIKDGLSVEDVLHQAIQDNAICVLPWAFGKWLGKRGRVIKLLLQKYKGNLFVGDNSGRPWVWMNVSQLQYANKLGIGILNGTDPLPIVGQEKKVGSFGFFVPKKDIAAVPSQIVKASLHTSIDAIEPYGKLEHLPSFCINQVKLRKLSQN